MDTIQRSIATDRMATVLLTCAEIVERFQLGADNDDNGRVGGKENGL